MDNSLFKWLFFLCKFHTMGMWIIKVCKFFHLTVCRFKKIVLCVNRFYFFINNFLEIYIFTLTYYNRSIQKWNLISHCWRKKKREKEKEREKEKVREKDCIVNLLNVGFQILDFPNLNQKNQNANDGQLDNGHAWALTDGQMNIVIHWINCSGWKVTLNDLQPQSGKMWLIINEPIKNKIIYTN